DIPIPAIIKHVAHAILREVACFFLPAIGNRKHNYLPIKTDCRHGNSLLKSIGINHDYKRNFSVG
ncbi:MAG: hypothetical protein J6586_08440, partial [Snodgrassella sp.]|nr:hypothetical protein [Snodgrassella sp.]